MNTTTAPRVALFTDSYYEANGVARTANALEAFAAERDRPLLVVHGGRADQLVESGSIARLELNRWRLTSVALEHDLRFDAALWRQTWRVARVLRWFQPDVLHFTGPSDIGQIGMLLGGCLGIPMVGSWHTNLHEYASRRLLSHLPAAGERTRMHVRWLVERFTLRLATLFYRIPPRVVLAPNEEWAAILEWHTRKPTFVMTRGVDTAHFNPSRRTRSDVGVNVGYVGRLSVEKNVRALAVVRDELARAGVDNVRFTIVGDGIEREWLQAQLPGATFTGVLRGDALADAYANLDLFVFPSETETVGNVILEAMASGVPVVAMARGGQKYIAASPASAVLAHSVSELAEATVRLARDPARRQAMSAAARNAAVARGWAAVFDVVYRAYDMALTGLDPRERTADKPHATISEEQSAA